MKTYGIVGVENVTVQSPVSEEEWIKIEDIYDDPKNKKNYLEIEHDVHSNIMRRRFAADGATETGYFPIS